MKKYIFILLVACFLLIPSHAAHADLIWPPANAFYFQHEEQIEYLDRSFCLNNAYKSASVKKAPGEKSNTSKLENSEPVYIKFSCLYGGDYWGYSTEYNGWIKMDQLLVLYDYITFEEEHQEELYPYEGDYREIKQASAAIMWPWPGSGDPQQTLEGIGGGNFGVSHAFKDKEDREWGFVSYHYGSQNMWVCLSDPLNRDIPAFNPAPEPAPWVPDTVYINIDKTSNSNFVLIVTVILVAIVAIVTAILIKVFWKSDKTKKTVEIKKLD